MKTQTSRSLRRLALGLVAAVLLAALAGTSASQEQASGPVKVSIKDEKPVIVEQVLPVDPQRRINYQPSGLSVMVRGENNETLHLSMFPGVLIDGQFIDELYMAMVLPQAENG